MNKTQRIPIQIYIPIISDKQNCCPYEEPYGYIYLITNKVNGHMYVGQHEFHHPWLDKSYRGSGKRLWKAYNSSKYDKIRDFDIVILQWIEHDLEELNKAEIYWIDMFGTFRFPFHYNETEGGDGVGSGENNFFFMEKVIYKLEVKIICMVTQVN